MGMVTCISGSTFIKTGTGKSWTAGKLGEDIDSDFDINKVVYHPKEFLTVMNLVENTGKSGQVVVIDEGEITAPANMYYSFTNKAIFYTLATFRTLHCMAIFVTPTFAWLDKRVRTLVSHWGYTEKTMGSGGKISVKLKMFAVKTNMIGDKQYFQRLTMYNRDMSRLVKFNGFNVAKPSEQFQIDYEKKSLEFKQTLRKGLIPEMEKFEKFQLREEKKPLREIVDEIASSPDIIRSMVNTKGKMDRDIIREKYSVTYWEARRIKDMVEKLWSGGK
jgi:hypothetical protein